MLDINQDRRQLFQDTQVTQMLGYDQDFANTITSRDFY